MENTSVSEIAPQQVDLDKLMKDKLEEQQKNAAPEDVFASMHYFYAPLALRLLPKLSKKELIRVVAATVEIPPNQKRVDSFDKIQKDLFFMLEKVYLSKHAMFLQAAVDQEEKKMKTQGGNNGVVSESQMVSESDRNKDGTSQE